MKQIETAPKDKKIIAIVDGKERLVMWTKASHVPFYGFCCIDGDPEDVFVCEPSGRIERLG